MCPAGGGEMKGNKHTGQICNSCDTELTSWDLRCSKALGYKHGVCENCIAKEYDKTIEELRDTLEEYFGMRPCQGL
jgi:predicted amidophosphoribosyltransferase